MMGFDCFNFPRITYVLLVGVLSGITVHSAMLRENAIPCESDSQCAELSKICLEHITECNATKYCVDKPTSVSTCEGIICAKDFKCRPCNTQEVTSGRCTKDIVCFNKTVPTACTEIQCAAPKRCVTEHFPHRRCVTCPCPNRVAKCEQECSSNSNCAVGEVCEIRNKPPRKTTPEHWSSRKLCYPAPQASVETP